MITSYNDHSRSSIFDFVEIDIDNMIAIYGASNDQTFIHKDFNYEL